MSGRRQTAFEIGRARRKRLFVLLVGVTVAVTLLGMLAASSVLHVASAKVDGVTVPIEDTIAWAIDRATRWEGAEVTLLVDGRPFRMSRASLGGRLPPEVLNEKLERALSRDLDGPPEIRWRPEVDHAALLEAVFDLRETSMRRVQSSDGRRREQRMIDLHASLKVVRHALENGALVVDLPLRSVSRLSNTTDRASLMNFDRSLSRHQSNYRNTGRSQGRAKNIRLAARLVDGVLIEPGADLSFNEVVGPRTFARGFEGAKEIAGGRVIDGVGGGVCQVATALHDAAVRAGFEIIEHYVHSKRPRYAGRGIDTAVAWGLKDLRIRNPFREPVLVRAQAYDRTLELSLVSGFDGPKVDVETRVLEGSVRDTLNPMVVLRTRTVHWPGGPITTSRELRYRPEPQD